MKNMKKLLSMLLLVCMLCSCLTVFAESKYEIVVNFSDKDYFYNEKIIEPNDLLVEEI